MPARHESSGTEVKVDETGSRDLDLVDQLAFRNSRDNNLRDLSRIASHGLGETHGNVGREVAMARVTSTLDRRSYRCDFGGFRQLRKTVKCSLDQVGDFVFFIFCPILPAQNAALTGMVQYDFWCSCLTVQLMPECSLQVSPLRTISFYSQVIADCVQIDL